MLFINFAFISEKKQNNVDIPATVRGEKVDIRIKFGAKKSWNDYIKPCPKISPETLINIQS